MYCQFILYCIPKYVCLTINYIAHCFLCCSISLSSSKNCPASSILHSLYLPSFFYILCFGPWV